MENNYLLTTFDNPFNPFVDFSSWYMFDCEKGHNSSSRLARIANINSEMTQKEIDEERERAMKLIIKYDLEDTFFMGTEEQIEKWLKSDAFKEVSREINQKSEEINKNFEANKEKQTATATNA